MSIVVLISAMLFNKANRMRLTSVNKLAFSMEIVKCKEGLHQTRFEKIFRESMTWITIE